MYNTIAHLAHTEAFLLTKALGKMCYKQNWLKKHEFGSSLNTQNEISYKKLIKIPKKAHKNGVQILDDLTDEVLKQDNKIGFVIESNKFIKATVMRQTKHEDIYTVYPGLLCKLQEIKTV